MANVAVPPTFRLNDCGRHIRKAFVLEELASIVTIAKYFQTRNAKDEVEDSHIGLLWFSFSSNGDGRVGFALLRPDASGSSVSRQPDPSAAILSSQTVQSLPFLDECHPRCQNLVPGNSVWLLRSFAWIGDARS